VTWQACVIEYTPSVLMDQVLAAGGRVSEEVRQGLRQLLDAGGKAVLPADVFADIERVLSADQHDEVTMMTIGSNSSENRSQSSNIRMGRMTKVAATHAQCCSSAGGVQASQPPQAHVVRF